MQVQIHPGRVISSGVIFMLLHGTTGLNSKQFTRVDTQQNAT